MEGVDMGNVKMGTPMRRSGSERQVGEVHDFSSSIFVFVSLGVFDERKSSQTN